MGDATGTSVWFSGTKSVTADGRKLTDMPAGWYSPVKTEIKLGCFVTTYRTCATGATRVD